MTDKQIICKPENDFNNKIINEKGNTNCIFYSDNICRKGDRTRDCINCARVEYHSLYSLNWDNQERLYKIIVQKEQECEVLKEKVCSFENCTNFEKYGKEIAKLKQTLNEIKQIAIREFETSRYNGSFTWKQILQKISECEGNDETTK
jgi:hypothetical protein